MYKVLFNAEKQRVPVKVWSPLETVESAALDQLKNMSSLPFVFKHVAAMPDVHLGKGATVGSVVATKGAVVPAAVGVDIGCGMMAVKINPLSYRHLDDIKGRVAEIRSKIEEAVPVGHSGNQTLTSTVTSWFGWSNFDSLSALGEHRFGPTSLKAKAMNQLGTLGGGNHFIELCEDTEGGFWIMLHSGSRNIGKSLAEIHIEKAKAEMKRMFISLPDPDLAYFAEGTDYYKNYLRDLIWAQEYAFQNRREMMLRILSIFTNIFGKVPLIDHEINCHHNYASLENHYGDNVLVTRKGAVRARKGDLGIIPGSMGAKSFIVEGLGNQESFHSCSHGAGRKMSRSEAKRRFTNADLLEQTAGVECRKDDGVIDEIPGAYKDIDEVMENQKDLVRVKYQLKQFMCVKG